MSSQKPGKGQMNKTSKTKHTSMIVVITHETNLRWATRTAQGFLSFAPQNERITIRNRFVDVFVYFHSKKCVENKFTCQYSTLQY